MISEKYVAENIVDHTVILKVNTSPLPITAGESVEFDFTEGKDELLYPKNLLNVYKLDEPKGESKGESTEEVKTKSESEPKVTEKKETASQAKARKAKEDKAKKAKSQKDVKIETEDK